MKRGACLSYSKSQTTRLSFAVPRRFYAIGTHRSTVRLIDSMIRFPAMEGSEQEATEETEQECLCFLCLLR
jgi:hypothetical protein